METIIQQIVGKMAVKCLDFFETEGLGALDNMAQQLATISQEAAKEMLAAFIDMADRTLVEAKAERMGDGIKIRRSSVPRQLVTALGTFHYKRTYFDTPKGREYLLDRLLQVEGYDRVDVGVSARLSNEAARGSYERAAAVATGGLVSRQTVRNKALRTGDVVHIPKRASSTPKTLHIFADEDHVHMQNGKSAILPLVTVCEGKREVCAGRHALLQGMHAQGYGLKPERLWEHVYAMCTEKYDMEQIETIFLYGDGAAWIDVGLNVFPNATRVLDEFHLKSRMKRLLAGDIGQALGARVRAALKKDDEAMFRETVSWMQTATFWMMPAGKERSARLKRVQENATYILNHWEAIQNIDLPGCIGSCTEAMISHVLSERFSRNPMGWSAEGLEKMAMLRVYAKNGEEVKATDIETKKRSSTNFDKYDALVRKQQEEVLRGAKDWSLFATGSQPATKPSGTRVLLRALGKRKKIS